MMAEGGAAAAAFPSEKHRAWWSGVGPGEEERAGLSASNQGAKGNRFLRPLLHQAAPAAVKAKGRIFELVLRPLWPRLGFQKAMGAMAHRLTRRIGKILQQGVRYQERGPVVGQRSRAARTAKRIKELRNLG
jgi:hypothetical protein